ncbi:hypothetical protein LBMAG42_43580 [Deltaproteobacteria bacterium]|nr:hypothetical protein LBMAG42_43580 [Deltaproteobacteria bacterium]
MIVLLLACVGNPELSPSSQGCTNYDFDEPQDSTVEYSVDGDVADVWRTYVERDNTDDSFEPDLSGEGNVVEVHEKWVAGSDANATCLEPHVRIKGFGAPIEVRWFTADNSAVPVDTLEIEPQ